MSVKERFSSALMPTVLAGLTALTGCASSRIGWEVAKQPIGVDPSLTKPIRVNVCHANNIGVHEQMRWDEFQDLRRSGYTVATYGDRLISHPIRAHADAGKEGGATVGLLTGIAIAAHPAVALATGAIGAAIGREAGEARAGMKAAYTLAATDACKEWIDEYMKRKPNPYAMVATGNRFDGIQGNMIVPVMPRVR